MSALSMAQKEGIELSTMDFKDKVKMVEENTKFTDVDTFWSEESINELYRKENALNDVEFDQKLYDDSLLQLNKVCWEIKKKIKNQDQAIMFERLRTTLLGNNMIPKFCGYGVQFKYDTLKNLFIEAMEKDIPTDPMLERIERDVCCGMCLAFAPIYIELVNTARMTFAEVKEFTDQIETNERIRRKLLGFSQTFMRVFDYADSKTLNDFMRETNFAPAFNLKNGFISFNHIYDNIEKYCDPAKINGVNIPVNLIMNCYKIIDKKMNVNYFKNKENFELKNQSLERDKQLDKTKIVNDEGDKTWMD